MTEVRELTPGMQVAVLAGYTSHVLRPDATAENTQVASALLTPLFRQVIDALALQGYAIVSYRQRDGRLLSSVPARPADPVLPEGCRVAACPCHKGL